MASSGVDQPIRRVFVWSLPRTVSTGLTKCLSYIDGTQIFFEPFYSAYTFGPEGITPFDDLTNFVDNAAAKPLNLDNAFDNATITYEWVKQQLQADYPDKKILLVKDHAHGLNERYDMIPPGFRHAFLIRHPYKVLPSWKRMVTKSLQLDYDTTDWQVFVSTYAKQPDSYEMQFNLLKYVKENLDPNPVIFDSDDLLSNPASILSQFCQGVGIPYDDKLLEWPEDRDVMRTWKASRVVLQGNLLESAGGFFETALKSRGFHPPTVVPKRSELSPDLQKVADYSMVFYEKMLKMCLRP